MDFILGILLGVGLTVFGIWITECIRIANQRKRLIGALYLEIVYNMMTSKLNLEICKDKEIGEYKFFTFHNLAFENFKQGVLLNEEKHSDILLNLFRGYALIDMFNSKRIEFEKELPPETEELFTGVVKCMKKVHDELRIKTKSVKL